MTDLELLFLVLALIYGWECACWLPRGSVAFRTWLGRRWRLAQPVTFLGNQRGAFAFAHPLPPLGTFLTGNQIPLSLSPEGVLAFVAPMVNPGPRLDQTGAWLAFDEIRRVETNGRQLRVNGDLFLKMASSGLADFLRQRLRHLAQLPSSSRPGALREIIRDSLDTRTLQKRWKDFVQQAERIRLLTNLLFSYLFVFAPMVIWRLGLHLCWPWLLAGLLSLTTLTAIVFHRTHKRFYPEAEDERFTHFLTILLSPATTIRALDVLSRPLLETFHPLALAKVFCTEDEFQGFATRILTEIRHPALPLCPRPEPLAQAAERYWRAELQKAAEEFLKKSGLAPQELMRPPAPADGTCRAFCPRCLSQFTTGTSVCADCGGLALVPFRDEQSKTSGKRPAA